MRLGLQQLEVLDLLLHVLPQPLDDLFLQLAGALPRDVVLLANVVERHRRLREDPVAQDVRVPVIKRGGELRKLPPEEFPEFLIGKSLVRRCPLGGQDLHQGAFLIGPRGASREMSQLPRRCPISTTSRSRTCRRSARSLVSGTKPSRSSLRFSLFRL